MPKVSWEGDVSTDDIDGFDRDAQYTPYSGPIPMNGIYAFKLKVLKYQEPKPGKKWSQLQIGLELVPRANRPEDKVYKGYFIQDWPPIAKHTAFRYVPFLDALEVSATDFINRTIIDEDGNIVKMGKWRNTGDIVILAGIADDTDEKGNPRKKVNFYGVLDDEVDEDDEEYEEYEEEEEEDF